MVQKEEGLGFIAHPKAICLYTVEHQARCYWLFRRGDIELYLEIGRLKRYTDKTITKRNRLRRVSEINKRLWLH